jgi:hypothetical protein
MSILLFDIQQILIANLAMQLSGKYKNDLGVVTPKGMTVDEGLLRHMVLNSIRYNKMKFPKYKEVVIATDGYSWRREFFKYYKAARKTTRDASSIDWSEIFKTFAKIKQELKEYFPYRVIINERAEADDVIAQIVIREAPKQDILIISGDKDFVQLQTFERVTQYDPTRKKFVSEPNPIAFLREHILRGDVGDGIPNVISDDDTFVVADKRQGKLTKTLFKELLQDLSLGGLDKEYETNYNRNKKLIDLKQCPKDLVEEIMTEYDAQEGKGRSRLFTYFVKYKLSNLLESISEF